MQYRRYFDPRDENPPTEPPLGPPNLPPDRAQGTYVHSDETILAVNVALATGRPLLVLGSPGCGKSSLASSVSRRLGWRYLERVVTSRMKARDLLYEIDSLRRLRDATAGEADTSIEKYIRPDVLWRAIDPGSANDYLDPKRREVNSRAVVLLDEIDKADPDVPNDLLVVVGAQTFEVPELDRTVEGTQSPFIVLTSNRERDLPAAFVRRCVVLEIPDPDRSRLEEISRSHFPEVDQQLLARVLTRFEELSSLAKSQQSRAPSTAEVLDALRACRDLGFSSPPPDAEEDKRRAFNAIVNRSLAKVQSAEPPP